MKDLIRNRWFVFLLGILIATVVLLGIGVILYCNGYRITYPQQFETSWDAVSGFAAWFGVVVSVVSAAASFFAIWFAVRVADKQNKITLFEKRYELYDIAISCRLFAAMLELKKDTDKAFLAAFYKIPADTQKVDASLVRERSSLIALKVVQFSFLFKDQKILTYMRKVMNLMMEILTGYLNGKETLEDKTQDFLTLIKDAQFAEILKTMEKELNLK